MDKTRPHHRLGGLLPRLARLSGLLVGITAVLGAGVRCAHVEPPSGGPADKTPPAVAAVYPAPGAVNVPSEAPVVFQFTEWIDRNAVRGAVVVSPPFPGRLRVAADGDRLEVRPPAGRGFRPGTTYDVTVVGALRDLRGNMMGRAFTLRFATGPRLDSATLGGSLSATERRGTLVAALFGAGATRAALTPEALSPRDTGYRPGAAPEPWRELPLRLAAADSAGAFRLEGAAPGDYALFAFDDMNGNFAFDLGLEAAAVGAPSLALAAEASAPRQNLHLVPLDTMPLRPGEAAFEAAPLLDPAAAVAEDSGARYIEGLIVLKFSRPPHPARAAEASRYLVVSDSGAPVPVRAAAWSPERGAWVLETPPLRANARHRVAVRGRPDFSGRADAGPDTSTAFDAKPSPSTGVRPVWSLTPRQTGSAGPEGLPRAAIALTAGRSHRFASSLPLTPALWGALENRVEARIGKDSVPAGRVVKRVDPLAFDLELARAVRAGESLRLTLRPAPGDTTPAPVLFDGSVPDSMQVGTFVFKPDATWRAWTFWLEGPTGDVHAVVRTGDEAQARVPEGRYALRAFHDRDADRAWEPGALKPWIPQELRATLIDTVSVTGGSRVDATDRVRIPGR